MPWLAAVSRSLCASIGPTVLNDRIDYITRDGNRSQIRVVGFFLVKDGKIAEWTDYVVRT